MMRFIQLTDYNTGDPVIINLDLVSEILPHGTGTRFYVAATDYDGERIFTFVTESLADITRFINTHVGSVFNAAVQIASYAADRAETAETAIESAY